MNSVFDWRVWLLCGFAFPSFAAEAEVSVRAFSERPFGVAEVTLRFTSAPAPKWYADQQPRIVCEGDRAFYLAWWPEWSPTADLQTLRCYFLFTGQTECTVRVVAAGEHRAVIAPQEDTVEHGKLLREWWAAYNLSHSSETESAATAQVQNYLRNMLSRRLRLRPPAGAAIATPLDYLPPEHFVNEQLGFFIGTVSIRAGLQNQRLLAVPGLKEVADRPLPKPTAPPALPILEPIRPETQVEPIALHTPAECFYVRCQQFSDYLWLREIVNAWGGGVDNLVGQEAFDFDLRANVERRLALAPDEAAREKLEAALSDFAVIGTDLFFRDGPSVGVLLEAKHEADVVAAIRRQRDAVLTEPGASEQEVHLGAATARLLTTPDGGVRSFYATQGKYHLVTTSAWIARRFLECGGGEGSLGRLDEFRYARQKMPLTREDQAFLYLSDPFFRTLVGPAYRVEMTRRAAALVDLRLVEAARLAAAAEGLPATTIDELVQSGFLPPGFGPRADGAVPELTAGIARDSLRGVAGGFLPIPDVEIGGLTSSEVRSYDRFAREYEQQWRRMDPVTIAVQRRRDNRGREQVALDFIIAPYATAHYGFLPGLLRNTTQRLAWPESMTMTIEASLFSFWDAKENITLLAGLKDFDPPLRIERGRLIPEPVLDAALLRRFELPVIGAATKSKKNLDALRDIFSYHGESEFGPPNLEGYFTVKTKGNLYPWPEKVLSGRMQKDYTILGLRREDFATISADLKLVAAERPAQIQVRIKDLQKSKLSRAIDMAGYLNARRVSAGNARLLHLFEQQFALAPAQIPAAAVRVVGGRPKCPLGGEFALAGDGPHPQTWRSAAWETISLEEIKDIPPDYRYPLLRWLRAVEIDFQIDATTLATHVELTLGP